MSDDNLILFPKKSKPEITMSNQEAKWMITGSLFMVLLVALGFNAALFSKNGPNTTVAEQNGDMPQAGRAIASINPIFKVSWEKRAFEVLQDSQARDLANIGSAPGPFEKFAFGELKGFYSIRKVDGKIKEIRFSELEDSQPKKMEETQSFLGHNLSLFSDDAASVEKVHSETNDSITLERFQLKGKSGQDLGTVQVLLDGNSNLLSMTVQ